MQDETLVRMKDSLMNMDEKEVKSMKLELSRLLNNKTCIGFVQCYKCPIKILNKHQTGHCPAQWNRGSSHGGDTSFASKMEWLIEWM